MINKKLTVSASIGITFITLVVVVGLFWNIKRENQEGVVVGVVSNEFAGYELKYPGDWVIIGSETNTISDSEDGKQSQLLISPNANGDFPNVDIFTVDRGQDYDERSIDEVASAMKTNLSNKDWKVVSENDFAYEFSTGDSSIGKQFVAEKESEKMLTKVIVSGKKTLRFMYINESSNYERDLEVVEKIFNHWVIEK